MPRSRTRAIVSYGLIVKAKSTNRYLIYQRRDNFVYMDFIRGIWSGPLHAQFFASMSIEEKERLWNYSFEELWKDLWVGGNCRIYREGYTRAYRKFSAVREKLSRELRNHLSVPGPCPPWGFPKGKKGPGETPLHAARREWSEETRMNGQRIQIIDGWKGIERFDGDNGKCYETQYFFGECEEEMKWTKISIPTIRTETVSEEAQELAWIALEEAGQFLHPRRIELLTAAAAFSSARPNAPPNSRTET